jgi:hypothetical protein
MPPNATFLIGNDKTLKQALEAKQIDNAMCFSCGNDSTNEECSTKRVLICEREAFPIGGKVFLLLATLLEQASGFTKSGGEP